MTKTIVVYTILFLGMFVICLPTHQYVIDHLSLKLRYDLKNIHVFFALSSYIICVVFLGFTYFEKTKEQLGFLFLFTLFLKFILFTIFFYKTVIKLENMTPSESLHVLIPLFVFLLLEVVLISKHLNPNKH